MAVDVSESEISALMFEGEFFVVDAHQMHDGCVEVVNVDAEFVVFMFVGESYIAFVVDDVVSVVVCFSVGESSFDAPSSHPRREASGVMVSTIGCFIQGSLGV